MNAEADGALAAALARLEEVVYDPKNRAKSSRITPDPGVQEAITALNGNHAAAIALLRQALQDPHAEVKGRAAAGLGLIGPEAREAVADVVMPQDGSSRGRGPGSLGHGSELSPARLASGAGRAPTRARRLGTGSLCRL